MYIDVVIYPWAYAIYTIEMQGQHLTEVFNLEVR